MSGKAPSTQTQTRTSPKAPSTTTPIAASSDDVETTAISGISSVLEDPKHSKGVGKLILRTSTFKSVSTSHGQEMAQKVINEYFNSDDNLNGILNLLGYKISGAQVVPA